MSGFLGIVRNDGQPVSERLLEEIGEELRVGGPTGECVKIRGKAGAKRVAFPIAV